MGVGNKNCMWSSLLAQGYLARWRVVPDPNRHLFLDRLNTARIGRPERFWVWDLLSADYFIFILIKEVL
jgi:hypothetical protein